ncbi:DMT family transporter [Peribacillus deserti]|uniref:EamA family transporter n=1 Tax=Peribacillus deserti TaxID=673318 RepID=A0A2N5M6F2_9BACI|nr:DMT family transporter [Peribacillus deserti]PLT29944.1 EamA family transporter [Peribacillus deserti]
MRTYRIYILLLLIMIPWGLNVTATKVLVDQFMPLTMTAFRIMTAGIGVFLVLLLLKRFRLPLKSEWKAIILGAILNVAGHHSFLSIGLKHTSGVNGGLILGIGPLLTVILSVLFLGSRLTWIKVLGFIIGVSGVFITVLEGKTGLQGASIGDFEVFLSMLSQAFSFILIKQASKTMDPRLLTGYMLFIGSFILLIIARLFEPEGIQSLSTGNTALWAIFLASALIATAFGHMSYNYCIGKLGAAEASIFLNLIPFFSLLGSGLFLGEKITASHLLGLVFIIAGVIIGSGAYKQLIFRKNKGINASL